MRLEIDILEEEYNECKTHVDMIRQEGFLIESLNTALKIHVANGKPLKEGAWKEVYAETDYRNGWIEFSCEACEYQHGIESGEYGWSYGDPIPWKYCPICGARMVEDDKE